MLLFNFELFSLSLLVFIIVILDVIVVNQLCINQVICYYQGDILLVEVNGGQFSVDLNKVLLVGCFRVNCIVFLKIMVGCYFWYLILFFRVDKNGKYLD